MTFSDRVATSGMGEAGDRNLEKESFGLGLEMQKQDGRWWGEMQ